MTILDHDRRALATATHADDMARQFVRDGAAPATDHHGRLRGERAVDSFARCVSRLHSVRGQSDIVPRVELRVAVENATSRRERLVSAGG